MRTQQFYEWHSATKGSTAYQFLPNRSTFRFGEAFNVQPELCTFEAKGIISRSAQTYGNPYRLREIVSLYEGSSAVHTTTEFTMTRPDRELTTRYKTDIDNAIPGHYFNSTQKVDHLPSFETDSNGWMMMRRVTNKTAWARNRLSHALGLSCRQCRPAGGHFYQAFALTRHDLSGRAHHAGVAENVRRHAWGALSSCRPLAGG